MMNCEDKMNSIFNILQNLQIDSRNYKDNYYEDYSKLGHLKYFVKNLENVKVIKYENIENKPIKLIKTILLDDIKMIEERMSNGVWNFYSHTFSRYVERGYVLLKGYSLFTTNIRDILPELEKIASMLKYNLNIEYILNDMYIKVSAKDKDKTFILFTSEIGLSSLEIKNKYPNPLNQLYSLEKYTTDTDELILETIKNNVVKVRPNHDARCLLDWFPQQSKTFTSIYYTPYHVYNFQFCVIKFKGETSGAFFTRNDLIAMKERDGDLIYGILNLKVDHREIKSIIEMGIIPSQFNFLNIVSPIKYQKFNKPHNKFILQIGELDDFTITTIDLEVEFDENFYKKVYKTIPERIILPKIDDTVQIGHFRIAKSRIYYIDSLNTFFITNKIIWDFSKEIPLKFINELTHNSTTIEIFKAYLEKYYNLSFKFKILYTLDFDNLKINVVMFKSGSISFTAFTTIYPMLLNLIDVLEVIVDIHGCDGEFVKMLKVLYTHN